MISRPHGTVGRGRRGVVEGVALRRVLPFAFLGGGIALETERAAKENETRHLQMRTMGSKEKKKDKERGARRRVI